MGCWSFCPDNVLLGGVLLSVNGTSSCTCMSGHTSFSFCFSSIVGCWSTCPNNVLLGGVLLSVNGTSSCICSKSGMSIYMFPSSCSSSTVGWSTCPNNVLLGRVSLSVDGTSSCISFSSRFPSTVRLWDFSLSLTSSLVTVATSCTTSEVHTPSVFSESFCFSAARRFLK